MQARSVSGARSHAAKLFELSLTILGSTVLCLFSYYAWSVVLDGKGTYHHTTDVADLDGDGDLDVIVASARWESEDTSFAGITLWINQGGGQFTPGDQELPGGSSAAAGDVDGDGDADFLVLGGYELRLFWTAIATRMPLSPGLSRPPYGGTMGRQRLHSPASAFAILNGTV